MSLLQLNHIKTFLNNHFNTLIDTADVKGDESKKEESLLTRALAALSIKVVQSLDDAAAASSITDGFDDCGIDAIYHNPSSREIVFVQSKWSHDGNKTIDQAAALKFISGLRKIVKNNLSDFNLKVKSKANDIKAFLDNADYTAIIVIAHVGNQPIGDYAKKEFDAFVQEFNDTSELFMLRELGQKEFHEFLRAGVSKAVDLDIDLYNFGIVKETYPVYYGTVPAKNIADWREEHGNFLVEKNIRSFLGDTSVNNSILETLTTAPENFLFFNNGLTLLCSDVKLPSGGAGKTDHRRLICQNVQIINGAQTVNACHKAKYDRKLDIDNAKVMVKIVVVGEDDGLSEKITRAANTQNKIERKDFVSLDRIQKSLQAALRSLGYNYTIKSGEELSPNDNTLTIESATHALVANSQSIELCSLAKREIGKIWESEGKFYSQIFNDKLTAEDLVATVKKMRLINAAIDDAVHKQGQNSRYNGYATHGNIFTALQIFKRTSNGMSPDTIKNVSSKVFKEVCDQAETLYPGSYLAHLFRNTAKCTELDAKLRIPPKLDTVAAGHCTP
jgi:hypothetical protein